MKQPTPDLPMNRTSGARRLRRFNIRCLKAFEQGSGVNAALQFRVSMRECFRGILSQEGKCNRASAVLLPLVERSGVGSWSKCAIKKPLNLLQDQVR